MNLTERVKKQITVASTITSSGCVKAGGTNVIYGLYTAMTKFFDIEVIYIAPPNETYRRYEVVKGLTEIVIPKTKEHVENEKKLNKNIQAKTLYDIALMHCLKYTPNYGEELRKSIAKSSAVIIDRPYLLLEVKKYTNGRPVFQRSHNIEYFYRMANMPDNKEARKLLSELFDLEKECCDYCDINFACSEEDLKTMQDMYEVKEEKLAMLPNGIYAIENKFVSVSARLEKKERFKIKQEKIAVFIGGGHKPNIEACEIILSIAPFCSDTKFFLIGPQCDTIAKYKRSDNVGLLGSITEKSRSHIFSLADIALNPMRSGSGSNVKMFDYMAVGIPIITTTFGARGICDKKGFHIADKEQEMIDCLQTFSIDLEEPSTEYNRKLIENYYDWNIIAKGTAKKMDIYLR